MVIQLLLVNEIFVMHIWLDVIGVIKWLSLSTKVSSFFMICYFIVHARPMFIFVHSMVECWILRNYPRWYLFRTKSNLISISLSGVTCSPNVICWFITNITESYNPFSRLEFYRSFFSVGPLCLCLGHLSKLCAGICIDMKGLYIVLNN